MDQDFVLENVAVFTTSAFAAVSRACRAARLGSLDAWRTDLAAAVAAPLSSRGLGLGRTPAAVARLARRSFEAYDVSRCKAYGRRLDRLQARLAAMDSPGCQYQKYLRWLQGAPATAPAVQAAILGASLLPEQLEDCFVFEPVGMAPAALLAVCVGAGCDVSGDLLTAAATFDPERYAHGCELIVGDQQRLRLLCAEFHQIVSRDVLDFVTDWGLGPSCAWFRSGDLKYEGGSLPARPPVVRTDRRLSNDADALRQLVADDETESRRRTGDRCGGRQFGAFIGIHSIASFEMDLRFWA